MVWISVFDHWQPEISFQWEMNLETLLCPTKRNSANAGNPSRCQTYFSIIYRNTPSPRFSWLHCTRISGSTTILRMEISPCSQRFGHGQCQESYLFGLILGLIYKLPCRVNFDSCTIPPFFGKSSRKIQTHHNSLRQLFLLFMCHVHVPWPNVTSKLERTAVTTLQFVEMATNHSHILSALDYSQRQINLPLTPRQGCTGYSHAVMKPGSQDLYR